MKEFRTLAIALAFSLVLPLLAQARDLPSGTSISVTLNQAVSSKTAKAGQTIDGTVAHDVVAGGKVIIPKGSAANLTVASVQASGAFRHPPSSGCRFIR